jgi:hypothetical protein
MGFGFELPDFVEVITGHDEPNPKSHEQIKAWLNSLGWKPETFKYVKDKKTGETRQIPQVSTEQTKEICPSIKKLYDKEPRLELLEGLNALSHRIGILQGFLRDERDGYLKARIQGLTNTLRFQHAEIVNLPRVDRPYAKQLRGSLICEDDEVLLGADMSSLEDRLKQHFIYSYDPEYVKSMMKEGFDPHLDLAIMAGEINEYEGERYKLLDVKKGKTEEEQKEYIRIKKIRSIFKNTNYACQYGAYPKRLSLTANISIERAKELFDMYWQRNWAIKQAAEDQEVKELNGQKWLFNPISKLWYSLRSENDKFSTLVQGSASFCFDMWVGYILQEWNSLTGQFHDEIVIATTEADKLKEIIERAIVKTNKALRLNRELTIGIQTGKRYSEIH